MTKQEFIEFLKKKQEERGVYLSHWRLVSENGDFWDLYKPCVDWVQDDMDLREEGVVIITYNQSLYDNESAKEFRTTYEDFVKNYDKTLGR